MNLAFKEFGTGKPLLIIHGLYGSSDNWVTIARKLDDTYRVIIPDLRNHGGSLHTEMHTYPEMVKDLHQLIKDLDLEDIILIGHSMGGKVAMLLAAEYPELFEKLVVVDISPFTDPANTALQEVQKDHQNILTNLSSLPITELTTRSEVETFMKKDIKNSAVRQFLLKNLKRKSDNHFEWKINVPVLKNSLNDILGEIALYPYKDSLAEIDTLFIKGAKSPYLQETDFELIAEVFHSVQFKTINNAGHWIHAEQPEEFLASLKQFFV